MEGLSFSIPYLIFTGLLMVLSVAERFCIGKPPVRRSLRYGCIVLYLLFVGLRGYIGTDWYSYRLIFDAIPTLFSDGWKGFWAENLLEPGFVFLTSALKTLWNDYHFFVLVNACLDMLLMNLFLRRYVDWYTLGFLIFFAMGGLTLAELMRNVRGIFFFLLSLKYLTERRPLPYFGLNLLGMLFHISSIFYLPLYCVLHRRWPKALFIAVFLAGNAVFLFQVEFVRPLIEWGAEALGGKFAYLQAQYLMNELLNEPYRLSVGYLERIVTPLLILGFYRKLHHQKNTNVLFINAYVLYFGSFFFFSEIRELSARFSLLFIFAYWVLIPALYETMRIRFNRALFMTALYAYCLLKINGMTSVPLYRYDNLLWGVESYGRRVEEFDRFYLNR